MVNKVACITVALVASLASAGVTEAAAGTHAKGFGSLCALLVDAESAPGIAAAAAKETAEAVRSAIEEAERHANALLGDAATMSLGQAAVKLLGGSVTRAGKETRANFSCDEGIAEGTNGSICALQRMAKSAQQEAKSVAAASAQALLGAGATWEEYSAPTQQDAYVQAKLKALMNGGSGHTGHTEATGSRKAMVTSLLWICNDNDSGGANCKNSGTGAQCACATPAQLKRLERSHSTWTKLDANGGDKNSDNGATPLANWKIAKQLCAINQGTAKLQHMPQGRLERDIANFNAMLRPMQTGSSANALLCLSLDSGADAAQNTCRGQGTDDALACVCYDKSGNTKLPDWVDKLAAMDTALQKTLSLQTQAHALIQRTQQATAHATLTAAHRTSTAQSTRRNTAQSNSAKATKTQSSDPALEGEDTPAEKNASAECNAQHPTWKPDTQTCDSTTINTEQTAAPSRTRTRTHTHAAAAILAATTVLATRALP
ncbi:hypothetical protein, conserved in T. vivax [Trypanosoma vivax Y486]|uniref:Variant surface glycoprotein (VSG) n=1 Tax=Trypanosoma vivax (strain Y486) TaxID=1055687 RepID=F9WMV7_TRYVY|nr:hypothetical protein, conserved in T. vivax [Trypanosoma vivax Y486]|eukprot:CCD18872.1 hypothetical protein, conserved in T. vivax [Trypanosoma vivax Y486]